EAALNDRRSGLHDIILVGGPADIRPEITQWECWKIVIVPYIAWCIPNNGNSFRQEQPLDTVPIRFPLAGPRQILLAVNCDWKITRSCFTNARRSESTCSKGSRACWQRSAIHLIA